MNNYIKYEILNNENFDENVIKNFNIVIITKIMQIVKIIKINNICHKNKIGFIYCLVFGLSFYCFVDFGEHVISNLNNKETKTFFIKNIEKRIKTKITIDNELEEFILNEDDFIIFIEIKGMKQLLNGTKKQIQNLNNNFFEIEEDSSNMKIIFREV